MNLFNIIAFLISTTLIYKVSYSPFSFVFRAVVIIFIVLTMRTFVLQ